MPSTSKSRSSVAAELVLALSKPKGKVIKGDEAQKPSEKSGKIEAEMTSNGKNPEKIISSPGNNDWISFLKTKQGNDNSSPSIKEPASKTPTRKLKRNIKTSSPKVAEKIKSEPVFEPNKENSKKEKEKDKDLVLKSLMEQVSSLETTLGEKIQNLEASLKLEKSKCKQFETSLEKEMKLQQEASSKLKVLRKDNDHREKELQYKIDDLIRCLEEEKRKGIKIASDFAKHKVDTQEEIKLKDIELIEILTENEVLRSKMKSLITWKEELTRKVSDSIHYCRVNHTDKLQTVIDENLKLRSVMKAAKDNFKEVTNDMTKSVNSTAVENANLKTQICFLEEDLTAYKQKREITNIDSNNSRRKEFRTDNSMNVDRSEDENIKSMQENSKHASRKRKRPSENVPDISKKLSLDEQAKVPDDEVECLSENNQVVDAELMKKTKENLRDAILSQLSGQDEVASDAKVQSNNLDESLLQSPKFDPKVFDDDAKGDSSGDSVTLDEDLQDDDRKEEARSLTKSPLPWIFDELPNKKAKMESYNSSSDNFFRLINECEDKQEEVQDEYDEVNLDLLYGDLEVNEESTDNLKQQVDLKSDNRGVVECELDESFGSIDSNELVIDLDKSCDSFGTEEGSEVSISSDTTIKEMVVELVNSI